MEDARASGSENTGRHSQLAGYWISLFFQGMEAWFDWKRTGYPTLTPAVDNQNDDKIPVRFIYPIIEQSLNAENRADAVSRQGADDLNSRVWWDVAPN